MSMTVRNLFFIYSNYVKSCKNTQKIIVFPGVWSFLSTFAFTFSGSIVIFAFPSEKWEMPEWELGKAREKM